MSQPANWLSRDFAGARAARLPVAVLILFAATAVHAHERRLHFSHPLIAESPSPDTKVRMDYFFSDETGEERATRHLARLEMEYAFRPWVSLETDIPYAFLDPKTAGSASNLGNVSVALKLASFAFAQQGLLLVGGLETGLPTGDSNKNIGSSHVVELEPFVDVGLARGDLELIAFVAPAFPTNENGEDEAGVELGWNVSLGYHLNPRLESLLELDGERVFGGEEAGHSTAYVTPGLKVSPFATRNLQLGAGVSLPVSDDRDFHTRVVVSVFYHF